MERQSEKIDPQLLINTLRSVVMQIGSKFMYSKVDALLLGKLWLH